MAEQTPGSETPASEAAPVAPATPATPATAGAAAGEPPKSESAAPAADAAKATPASPADAGKEGAKKEEPSKANAAADAAKNAAKAGLDAFKKIGTGAAGKLVHSLKSIASLPLLIFRGDLNTRLLTLGFAASLVLICVAAARLYERFMPAAPSAHTAAGSSMSKFLEGEKQLAIATANMVFLDKFSASVSASTGGVKVLEFELFVENDSPETSSIVKGHLEEVREFVANAIQGLDYDKLITPEGKDALKKHLTEALNRGLKRWTKKGQIKQLFFTRFVMG